MVVPNVSDGCRSKWSGWIHTGTSIFNKTQMSNCYGQTNSQWSDILWICKILYTLYTWIVQFVNEYVLRVYCDKPSLLLSQTPNTVNTRTNPKKNSIPRPCNGVTSVANFVWPMPWWYISGKRDFNDAIPAKAPQHCTTMYKKARTKLILPVTSWDIVTAGLIWPPLTCPIAYLFKKKKNNKSKIWMRSFQANELYYNVKMANGWPVI